MVNRSIFNPFRIFIAVLAALSLIGMGHSGVQAETGLDPVPAGLANDGSIADDAASDDAAIDFPPGTSENAASDDLDSLRKGHQFKFDEASIANAASARPAKWIEVVLSTQMLYAWENGRVAMSSKISSGTWAHPTVRGNFRVYVKYVSTRMRGPGYNLPNVPYTMYFYGGYGIHGAYWHNNFGHPMSHGCVNLPVPFSGQLFQWTPVGTLVYVH